MSSLGERQIATLDRGRMVLGDGGRAMFRRPSRSSLAQPMQFGTASPAQLLGVLPLTIALLARVTVPPKLL